MPLPRNVFDLDLLVDGALVELRGITVTHGDELRAELEGSRRGVPVTLPLALTSLMLWAACVRLGHFTGRYDEFKHDGLVEYRKVTDPTDVDIAGSESLDPTPEVEPTGPASSSPHTSPASSTGSTPTSTPA